jgi:hypothetical protein
MNLAHTVRFNFKPIGRCHARSVLHNRATPNAASNRPLIRGQFGTGTQH